MDEEQRSFLLHRFEEASARQPGLVSLRRMLLKLGGEEIVTRHEPDLDWLLAYGFLMSGQVQHQPTLESSCHENTANLWRSKSDEIVGIGTGYGLSDDGLWRQHSWMVCRDRLIETTEIRLKYFGILMQAQLADAFADRSLSGPKTCVVAREKIRNLLGAVSSVGRACRLHR